MVGRAYPGGELVIDSLTQLEGEFPSASFAFSAAQSALRVTQRLDDIIPVVLNVKHSAKWRYLYSRPAYGPATFVVPFYNG